MEKELPGQPPPPASKTKACQLRRMPPCLTPWRYKNVLEERLYIKHTNKQRARAIPRLLMLGLLLQIYVAIVPGETDIEYAYVSHSVWFSVNVILGILHTILRSSRPILNHIALLVVWMQLLDCVARRFHESYNELLGWAVVLQYFTFATLPFHHITLLFYSISFLLFYLLVQYMNVWKSGRRSPGDFYYQQTSNALLLICGSVMGCIAFVISEAQQRASFHRTKTSLLDKVTIEQQSKEQERLLLSVLPKHVAVKMRQDLGVIDEQFKKIYMSRHENVSILYADIVGFTAISSTYSAQDLVAILNELFARFDRLSEKYKQLRIKILGDCYYCISGAPIERWDHAILSVHMGLSMVKAIKYVQQITSSPVDMRVGIHTGAVLAGVLGQRQWQFDVYSRDVELANKMESSGMAGRVHVSEVTLKFLRDSFEVEPAHGERREEMLRQAGIKTYFIVKVLKPYHSEEKSAPVGEPGDGGEGGEGGDDDDVLSELKDDDEDSVLSPQEETQDSEDMKILTMLQEELVKRDDDRELADATTACLTFKNAEAEFCYARRSYPCPLLVVVPPLILLAPIVAVSSFAVPPSWAINAVYLTLIVEVGVVNILYYSFLKIGPIKKWALKPRYKIAFGVFNMAMFISANIVPLIICGEYEKALDDGLNSDAISHAGARRCSHASYYYHVAAGAACGVLWIYPISFVYRSLMVLFVAIAHSIPAILYPALLRPQPTLNYTMHFGHPLFDTWAPHIYSTRNLVMLYFIAMVLIMFNRYTESLERALHSRGERMRVQAEQASDLRRRNQALIHNVLPPHVATHFMGARHHHRDLYSQSYAEVGVLFASMPNFSEFYSEESVNNQGLECLRFLNEVISDFDMLLEDAKYCKDIIKIKTISSTYMAASGLDPARQMLPSDSITVRWAHLACLVDFALELQRVLSAINEQSFNHFVLRIGINHGPITAGVIGARKPHYDIWGNTVNVASRMESTGKVDCIQVTEETSQILRNFGFDFEQRGWVAVKGKGELMTYYLIGKKDNNSSTKQPNNKQLESSSQRPNGDASDSNSPLLLKSSF